MTSGSLWSEDLLARALEKDPSTLSPVTLISTDTRALTRGALFVALTGERYDGHDFLEQAREAGAVAAVVRRGTPSVAGLKLWEVGDTKSALGALARERRRLLGGPVVGITGTNGKTSTKEMLHALLSTKWRVHSTRANENNLVGVPLTILRAPAETDALVVEVGASEVGEVARLREVVEPTLAVITNVAKAHLDGFGSLERVVEEKLALLSGVESAVVGTDPPDLGRRAGALARSVWTAGLSQKAVFHPERWQMESDGHLRLWFDSTEFRVPALGIHQGENATVAVAAGVRLGLSLEEIAQGLPEANLPSGRCEILSPGSITLINDCYNSNPASISALLETVKSLRGDRQLVLLLGSMLELGPDSSTLHEEVTEAVLEMEPDVVGTLGDFREPFENRKDRVKGALVSADDPEQLAMQVRKLLEEDSIVVLKASRGVRLERAIPILQDREVSCSTTS